MPAQHSKFVIDVTCKEYAHPWTESCINATAGLGLHTFQECLRIYSTVYIITLLMRGKVPSKEDILKTILGILQSSAFLSWSGFSYSMFICILRRLMGNFNVLTVSFLPSFLSSLSAILIERPSRRTMLCLYVSNIATETLFRMGLWRGYYSLVPRGETYIFATSIALLLYFYRSKNNKQDSLYRIIRIIVGKYEGCAYGKEKDLRTETLTCSAENINEGTNETKLMGFQKKPTQPAFNIIWKSFEAYKKIIEYLKGQSKHVSCPHPYGCAYYVLTGGAKVFGCGVCVQLALKLVLQAKRLFSKPKMLTQIMFKRENLNLAVFLGGFAGLYRLISCLLRRTLQKDSNYYAIPAGLIASIAFLAYPDNTIALYFMWKALQLLWNDAAEKGKVPKVKWFTNFLYSVSTALLFHAAIAEPQSLRQSYWKFLYTISGGRVAAMSRTALDVFGLDTSRQLQELLRKTHTTDQHVYLF